MSILKPLHGEPLTFWHVAGDIIWRADGRPKAIDRGAAEAVREVFSAEARAAYRANDTVASRAAVRLWVQLTEALDAQDTWRRAVGCERRSAA